MIDVKLQNGEIALDAARCPVVLSDRDARFQRALIALTVKKGAFIYDRSLGADYDALIKRAQELGYAEDLKRKTEQIFNEALAAYEDTSVAVTQTGAHTVVRLRVNGETRSEEVVHYGNI